VALFVMAQSSLYGRVFARYLLDIPESSGVEEVFRNHYREIVKLLINLIALDKNAKILFVVSIQYNGRDENSGETGKFLHFRTFIYRHKKDIKFNMFKSIYNIVNTLNLFVMYGSSWNCIAVIRIDCYVVQIKPSVRKNRRGIGNIKAPGNLC
jgi:hypothetical protein